MSRPARLAFPHRFAPRLVRAGAIIQTKHDWTRSCRRRDTTIHVCAECGMSRRYAEWSGSPCIWRDEPRTHHAGAVADGAMPGNGESNDGTA